MSTDRINELRRELESLGCAVVIWVAADFPGDDPAIAQDNFEQYADTVCELCIEVGKEAITGLCAP